MATVARCLGIESMALGLALRRLVRKPALIARLAAITFTPCRVGESQLHLHLLLMHLQLAPPARFVVVPFALLAVRTPSSCGL